MRAEPVSTRLRRGGTAAAAASAGPADAAPARRTSRARQQAVYIDPVETYDSDGRSVEGWESDVSEWTAQQIRQQRQRVRSHQQREERARRRAAREAGRYQVDSSDNMEETSEDDLDDMSMSSGGGGRSRRNRRRKDKSRKRMTKRDLRAYLPSDWISMVAPTPAPFAPQIHDEVM